MKKNNSSLFAALALFVAVWLMLFGVTVPLERFLTSSPKTFSNTQTLGIRETQLLSRITPQTQAMLDAIPRIPFPAVGTQKAQQELDALVRMQSERTPAMIAQIKHQLYPNIDVLFRDMGASPKETLELKEYLRDVVDPIVMTLKVEYDRVRPSFLDTRIHPVITIPSHPAYPSGHSTQAFAIAGWLAQRHPQRRCLLFQMAQNIATNREYAGVHYLSDSEYGKVIASHLSLAL